MKLFRTVAFGASLAAAGAATGAPEHQVVTGPVAVYWMSASTTSGMGAMAAGPGGRAGRPNFAQMMMGGGMNPNAVTHTLVLQLGSQRRPQGGEPAAEHDPPPGLGVGPVLPLVTPTSQPTHEEAAPGPPPQYQKPHGRMLIFWGCGEHAGPGQPYVIDFASLGDTEGARRFAQAMRSRAINPMQPPAPGRDATYGEWPNERSGVSVPAEGSLQGDHVVKGNYTPDIHFSLAADQDFLPPVQMTANRKNPSGSASLGWRRVDGARGYFAGMFGSEGQDQVVMWTSSQVQAMPFGIPEYLSDREIARLLEGHVLMPSTQTDCVVPQEAVQAAGRGGFWTLTAYGGETNLSSPARPPAPKTWRIDWAVKVRYRSSTGGLLGMDMSQMMGGSDDEDRQDERRRQQEQPQQQHHRPGMGSFIPGLGGFIP